MNFKNTLTHILTKFRYHNRVLPNTRVLYSQSRVLINQNHKLFQKIQPSTIKQYNPTLFNITNKNAFNQRQNFNFLHDLKNKYQTTRLQWQYDPDFNLESFKRGSKQVRIYKYKTKSLSTFNDC